MWSLSSATLYRHWTVLSDTWRLHSWATTGNTASNCLKYLIPFIHSRTRAYPSIQNSVDLLVRRDLTVGRLVKDISTCSSSTPLGEVSRPVSESRTSVAISESLEWKSLSAPSLQTIYRDPPIDIHEDELIALVKQKKWSKALFRCMLQTTELDTKVWMNIRLMLKTVPLSRVINKVDKILHLASRIGSIGKEERAKRMAKEIIFDARSEKLLEKIMEQRHQERFAFILPWLRDQIIYKLAYEDRYVDGVLSWIDELHARNQFSSTEVYSILIYKLSHRPDLVRARELLNIMLSSHGAAPPSTQTFNCLLHGQLAHNNLSEALTAFQQMEASSDFRPDIITYNIFFKFFSDRNDFESIRKLYLTMTTIVGLKLNSLTLNILMNSLARQNRLDLMLQMINTALNHDAKNSNQLVRRESYNTAMSAFISHGAVTKAISIFDLFHLSQIPPQIRSYNILLQAYVILDDLSAAHLLLRRLTNEPRAPKPDCYTYTIIISGYARRGNARMVHQLFFAMMARGIKPTAWTYNALIHACTRAGRFSEGLSLLRSMSTDPALPKPSILTYNTIIAGLLGSSKFSFAYLLLNEAVQNGLLPNTATLNIFLRVFVKRGDWNGAKKIWIEMARLFGTIGDERTIAYFAGSKEGEQILTEIKHYIKEERIQGEGNDPKDK